MALSRGLSCPGCGRRIFGKPLCAPTPPPPIVVGPLVMPPPLPVVPSIVGPATEHRRALARELADIALASAKNTNNDRFLDSFLNSMERQDDNIAAMEAAFPGMKLAIRGAIKPIIEEAQVGIWPLYRDDLAALYLGTLTENELEGIVVAFRAPAFQKFFAGVAKANDYGSTGQRISAEGDIQSRDVARDLRIATIKSVMALTPEEREQVSAFGNSAVGQKMTALSSQKLEIDARWMNYSTPELERRVETAVVDAMVSHVGKTDPKAAEAIRRGIEKALKERDTVRPVAPNT